MSQVIGFIHLEHMDMEKNHIVLVEVIVFMEMHLKTDHMDMEKKLKNNVKHVVKNKIRIAIFGSK